MEDSSGPIVIRHYRSPSMSTAPSTSSLSRAPSRRPSSNLISVVAHLAGTNQFWAVSMSSGLAGSPTRILAAFDPVVTPAAMVESTKAKPAAEVLSDYCASLDQLSTVLTDLPKDAWSVVAESPA